MGVFVLVHGAFGGGWEWRGVEERLRALGHVVFRPTLTGLGERRHLLAPGVNLETHVEDVRSLIQLEDLTDVVLCGQSYGGMVITGVADRSADRIGRLVYIDALLPHDGESAFDLLPAPFAETLRDLARNDGEGTRIPFFLSVEDATAARGAWYAERLTDQPLETFEQRLNLRAPAGAGLPATYIRCTGEADDTFHKSASRAKEAGWRYVELNTHHDAQVGDPDGLVALLVAS